MHAHTMDLATLNSSEPASRWFSMSAAFLYESGVILLREPPDADAKRLLIQLLEGNYPRPFVVDDGVVRRLHFTLNLVQSEMKITEPYALQLGYTRKMMAFLLFVPRPKHVMIIGLGGGSLTKFCYRQLPRTRITTIEIDEDVIAFGELFKVPAPDERMSIIHADAIRYLATTDERADVILLDGFDKRGVAHAFCDAAFYQNLRARLRPGGMLVMNLVGAGDDYNAHVQLIAETFVDRMIVQDVSRDGNRLAFAFNDAGFDPDWPGMTREAKTLAQSHGLDFSDFAHKLQQSHQRQGRRGRRR